MTTPISSPLDGPARTHELRDVDPKYVGLFAVGMVVLVASVLIVVRMLLLNDNAILGRRDPPPNPTAVSQKPPAPRLQVDPKQELIELRRREDQRLHQYGWVDRSKRIVHIPIDRAISILAEQGLPEPDQQVESLRTQETQP